MNFEDKIKIVYRGYASSSVYTCKSVGTHAFGIKNIFIRFQKYFQDQNYV